MLYPHPTQQRIRSISAIPSSRALGIFGAFVPTERAVAIGPRPESPAPQPEPAKPHRHSMAPWNRKREEPALRAGSSASKAKAGYLERLQRRLGNRGRRAEPDASGNGNDTGRPGDSPSHPVPGTCQPTDHKDSPTTQSLWDRAYDALGNENPQLVKEYEGLLLKEAQKTGYASKDVSPAQPMPPDNAAHGFDGQSGRGQLDAIITHGLQRMEEKKTHTTDRIAKAADFVLWAKDWIGEAVKASPEASIAWAGVCIVLPLLTNPRTADEANRGGFTYVTARMRYYAALEPLLQQLGQDVGVTEDLMAEANEHIVVLYQHILEFQIRSVLRFYQSRIRGYAKDMFLLEDWERMKTEIEKMEVTVNQNLTQINELVSTQKLTSLNKTSTAAFEAMEQFLSIAERKLRVAEEARDIAGEQRDINKKELQVLRDMAKQGLSDKRAKCHQLFYLNDSNGATYEWYKNRVEDRIEGTCQWFLHDERFKSWLARDSGPLLVSADPGCGKSVLAKHLIDEALPRSATICYFFFKDQDQNTINQALCALLHQLFHYRPSLIEHAMPDYSEYGERLIRSTSSLWEILEKAGQDPQTGHLILVLDALDECRVEDFRDLVRTLKRLFHRDRQGHSKMKCLLTSRPYAHIVSDFQELIDAFPYIHIPGEEQSDAISSEVNHVIKHRVEQLATDIKLKKEIKDRLAERLLGIPHRTYLWVYLVFNYLRTEGFRKTLKGVESALTTLPLSVNDAYEKILS
ncbi:uncharacterized protein B0T15DRAFT_417141, partial [Chaetomium strumarium]